MTSIDDFIQQSGQGPASPPIGINGNHVQHLRGFEDDAEPSSYSTPVMFEAGFVSNAGNNATSLPLFSLTRVQYQLRAAVVALAVSNNILIMALDTNRLLRLDLDDPTEVDDIELPRKPGEVNIHRIFFDPTGNHLLVTSIQGENFYFYSRWKKAKALPKFKGLIIESVAWNPNAGTSSTSTKEFLLGTQTGSIYEAELEPTSEYFKKEERYLKEVYSLRGDAGKITGLHFETFPTDSRKKVVIVTTSTRMYQFIGQTSVTPGSDAAGVFDTLFANYTSNPNFQELPGTLDYSELHLSTPFESASFQAVPNAFAWLTEPGVYHGNLVFGSQDVGDSIVDNAQLLPYPSRRDDPPETPISIAITAYHFVLLYGSHLKAINQLTKEVVYEETLPLNPGETIIALSQDVTKRTFWVYSDQSIFELEVAAEDRDMWKLYLDRSMFDTALQHAKTPAQKDKIVTTRADNYFDAGRYILSATYYAQSSKPFEEVALKFVGKDERDALRKYLLERLERLRKEDRVQKTLLATWLIELYLSKINALEDLTAASRGVEDVSNYEAEQTVLEDEFKGFLTSYKSNLDPKTTYSLISSHGRTKELLHYAEIIGDSEKVISHWIQREDWSKALEILNKQNSVVLFQKYAAVLMEQAPQETVNVLIRHTEINPRDLIPGLLKYTHSRSADTGQNQAIRYLQFVIQQLRSTDSAIHNFLITLYATQKTSDESELLQFLASQSSEPSFDPDYALRMCSQNDRTQSCVHIYSSMGLYESAVDLALKHNDVELARINADKPDDEELRKKMWLRIATHVITKDNNIGKAIEFQQQSGILKIDDILPFLPDFVLIDDFKDELCSALEDYNVRIDELKLEMDEATKSAESIRGDLKELRARYVSVNAGERCSICELPLLTRQFYIFPCQHAFHADCLLEQATKTMSVAQMRKLRDLQDQITKEMSSRSRHVPAANDVGPMNAARNRLVTAGAQSLDRLKGLITTDAATTADMLAVGNNTSRAEQLKEQMDDLVASECLLCGEAMIKSIDRPFVEETEQEEIESWAI